MSVIHCPDCSKQVSKIADACPHCGRPSPAKSKEEVGGTSDVLGLLWLLHAIYVMWKWNFFAGIVALFLGPFVWLFR